MPNIKLIAVFLLVLSSCNPDRVNTEKVKEEMDRYKIKKITQGEILSGGEQLGMEITEKIQGIINSKRDSAMKAGSFEEALSFCTLRNYPIIKELENQYKANISRAGFPATLRNHANGPDALQSQVLEGYKYNMDNGLAPVKDVLLREDKIIFNNPIILNSKSCLQCHGKVGEDISVENYELIKKKYPDDQSINFKLNDPIGVWTVIIDKEEVIRNME